jgi:SAM-dependent MidA family methyltransferase
MTAGPGSLVDLVREEGRITFARYQELALYHPRFGYYASPEERTGWGGHYITSAQLDPSFGHLWVRGLEQVWGMCGTPDRFDVIEPGPGEGAFAASVLDCVRGGFRHALHYTLVERNPHAAARQARLLADRPGVSWAPSLEDLERFPYGCVIAHEVLDNQPVHLVHMENGELREEYIEGKGEGLTRSLGPLSDPRLIDAISDWSLTGTIEVSLAAVELATRCAGLIDRGAVFFVDYGGETGELWARETGTLVCYSAGGADDDPLDRPGDKDITSHVNWTLVRGALETEGLIPAGPLPQSDVLIALGLRRMLESAKQDQEVALAGGRGAEGFRAIARRQALAALTDPAGLGGLHVFAGWKEIDAPPFFRIDA